MISEAVRRFAEEPGRFLPEPSPPSRRISDERFIVSLGAAPWMTFVTDVRVQPDELEPLVEEVRALVADAGHERVAWAIGPSSRPVDTVDRLRDLGFSPAVQLPLEPSFTAMALVEPPEAGDAQSVMVREIDTFEDFRLADRILLAGSSVSDEKLASFEATGRQRWEAYVGRGVLIRFMAYVDDEPVAAAQLFPCEAGGLLGGSATIPEARGRGAYRALVRARWDECVRRATPALVIQAGAMSRPILERIGFAPLFEVPVLLDPATDG
jgi:GNAT superfamily N-acetyltransferase